MFPVYVSEQLPSFVVKLWAVACEFSRSRREPRRLAKSRADRPRPRINASGPDYLPVDNLLPMVRLELNAAHLPIM